MDHVDDPVFQAWLQRRNEAMMKAFDESIRVRVTERTQMIETEAQERYQNLVATTSTLQQAKEAELKSALERLSVLHTATPKTNKT